MPYPLSDALFARALRLIPGGVNSPVRAFRGVGGTPFFTIRATGCHLYTADGQELIDYVCTWGPALFGHNHPRILIGFDAQFVDNLQRLQPDTYWKQIANIFNERKSASSREKPGRRERG